MTIQPNTIKSEEIVIDYISKDEPKLYPDSKRIIYKLDEPYYIASLDLTTDKFHNTNSIGLLKQYFREFCMLNTYKINFDEISSLVIYTAGYIEQNNPYVDFTGLIKRPTWFVDSILSDMKSYKNIDITRDYIKSLPFVQDRKYLTGFYGDENQKVVNIAKGKYEKENNREIIDRTIDDLIAKCSFVHFDLIKQETGKGRNAIRDCLTERKTEIDNHNIINFGFKNYKSYEKSQEKIPDLSTSR